MGSCFDLRIVLDIPMQKPCQGEHWTTSAGETLGADDHTSSCSYCTFFCRNYLLFVEVTDGERFAQITQFASTSSCIDFLGDGDNGGRQNPRPSGCPYYGIEGSVVTVKASISDAVYPRDGENYSALIKDADLVMYRAKGAKLS